MYTNTRKILPNPPLHLLTKISSSIGCCMLLITIFTLHPSYCRMCTLHLPDITIKGIDLIACIVLEWVTMPVWQVAKIVPPSCSTNTQARWSIINEVPKIIMTSKELTRMQWGLHADYLHLLPSRTNHTTMITSRQGNLNSQGHCFHFLFIQDCNHNQQVREAYPISRDLSSTTLQIMKSTRL